MLPDDDPRAFMVSVYDWLGFAQETLIAALLTLRRAFRSGSVAVAQSTLRVTYTQVRTARARRLRSAVGLAARPTLAGVLRISQVYVDAIVAHARPTTRTRPAASSPDRQGPTTPPGWCR